MLLLLGVALYWSSSATSQRADFTFVNRGDIKTLDLAKMSYLQDIRMAYALWEGLYTLDAESLEPIPGCAWPIDISDDKKVYTFHLRPDAQWSNGEPLRAHDFVFAWKRICDEDGDYASLLEYIQGVKEYRQAVAADNEAIKKAVPGYTRAANFSLTAIQEVDGQTLRVTLVNPTPIFPNLCAFPALFPAHEKSMFVQERNGPARLRSDFTLPPNLVGNGPFKLVKWDFKRRLRLEPSPWYWDRAHVKSNSIEMKIIESPQAQFAAYDSGAVDWLSDLDGDFAAKLRMRNRADLHIFNGFGTMFYSFNCRPELPGGGINPFHDVRVRKAFAMAVDKSYIVDNITHLKEPIATTYIPPGVFPGYQSPRGLPYDVAAARKLLAEAGYPDGMGFPKLKINFNTEGIHAKTAEYMQRQFREALNIELELDGKEIKVFGEQLRNKNYAISKANWIGDYADVSTFTDKYLSVSGNNDADWQNPEYDRLCAEAARENDQDKRLALFQRAEQILCDEAPIMPLYHFVNVYMFRDGVHGIALNSRNMVMLKAASVDRSP